MTERALGTGNGRARMLLIDIYVKRSHGEYVLEITANGAAEGLNPDSEALGRLLMDYYASRNHVTLRSERTPGKGSLMRASFPLPAADLKGGS